MKQVTPESRSRAMGRWIPAALVMALALGAGKPCPGQVGQTEQRAYTLLNSARTDAEWQEALKLFQQMARKQPKARLIWYNVGICLGYLGRNQEALEAFQHSAALGEDDNTLSAIGSELVKLGRRAEAVPYFQKALAMSPDFAPYSAELGRTLYELGRYDEAIPMLERYIRDRGRDTQWDDRKALEGDLIESYAAMGKFQEAAVLFGRRRSIGMGVKMHADGLLVEKISRNMPADRAGIRPGDVLLSWKGMPLAGLRPPKFEEVVQAAALGDRVPVELNRAGQHQSVELLIGFAPGPAQPPVAPAVSLKIERVEVRPTPVSVGAPFEVTVDYTVTDPSVGTGSIAVEFGFQVLSGGAALFTQPAARIEGPNGIVRRRAERLVAAPRKGKYVFRTSLRYGSSVVEESTAFEVQ